MAATQVGKPFHRDGWVYEEKYDGWRMVAYKDGTAVRLVSRAGKAHEWRFAELAAAIRALPPLTLILDGEVAIFDDALISRFE
jgi:bifunctional non-homologous end joining protein LigD